jgi:hypothetical protein
MRQNGWIGFLIVPELSRMAPYEKLDAWKACHQLMLAVYRITNGWPDSEKYGFVSQIRRAAFSAAVNIVEGTI